jgi:hypothetical protein
MKEIISTELEIGRTYDIRSQRKGNFWGRFIKRSDEFGNFQIVSGKAKYVSEEDRIEGDIVSLRFELCKFFSIHEQQTISITQFGKDHWSTFAYIEVRCVDNDGKLDKDHLRTDIDIHPLLIGETKNRFGIDPRKYPTRLKDNVELHNHDDWSCIEDFESIGLLTRTQDDICRLTERGFIVAGLLRKHKAQGGTFANFQIPENIIGVHNA